MAPESERAKCSRGTAGCPDVHLPGRIGYCHAPKPLCSACGMGEQWNSHSLRLAQNTDGDYHAFIPANTELPAGSQPKEPTLTCSEVVESAPELCNDHYDCRDCAAYLAWRERRVQELEEALELCMGVIWGEFHTGPTDDMTGDNEADVAYRAGQKALANSEQIRKGAKHE